MARAPAVKREAEEDWGDCPQGRDIPASDIRGHASARDALSVFSNDQSTAGLL